MGRVALRSSLVGRCGFVVDECFLWNEFVPTERIHSPVHRYPAES